MGRGRREESPRIFPIDELTILTGDTDDGQLCKTLIHLVMADFAYLDNSEQGNSQCSSPQVVGE